MIKNGMFLKSGMLSTQHIYCQIKTRSDSGTLRILLQHICSSKKERQK